MLVLASVNSGLYKLWFFLHIVSIVIAFAPAVIHPIMSNQIKNDRGALATFAKYAYQNTQRIYGTALIAAGAFGILLVISSDKYWEFSQGWVSGAFVVWVAMLGVLHGLLLPAAKKLSEGDTTAEQRVAQAGMLLTLLFLVMLYLMIWKPGV